VTPYVPPSPPAPQPQAAPSGSLAYRRLGRSTLPGLRLVVLALAFALAALLLDLRTPATAATLPVVAEWRGELRPGTDASWWWAEGLAAEPVVTVVGGEGGLNDPCEDDGAGTKRCTVYAQGCWRRVVADGEVIAARIPPACPVYLPLAGRRP
jgi:hypothetical protein